MTQPQKIDYIIEKTAEYFGLSVVELTKARGGGRTSAHRKKMYLSLILYNNTETTMKEISERVGYYDKNTISRKLKYIKEELDPAYDGYAKTKMIYKELLEHLNLKSYEEQS